MKIKILLNPTAGRGRALEAQRTLEKTLSRSDAGYDYDLERTAGPDQVTAQARRAAKEGYDLIVAAGGDGTVNQVVNGLVGSNVPMAVLPCGTGNDFAAMIGMPTDIAACLRQILNGRVAYVDLGKVNDRYFISSVGAGFDGQVAYNVNRGFPHLRGIFVYVLGIFKTIFSYPGHHVRLTVDGKADEFDALLVAVNNSKTYGGGLKITPDAVVDDGFFEICSSRMMHPLEICWHLPKLIKGTHGKLKKIRLLRGKEVVLQSDTPLYYQVDGEIEQGRTLRLQIFPRAFPIMGSALPLQASASLAAAALGD